MGLTCTTSAKAISYYHGKAYFRDKDIFQKLTTCQYQQKLLPL